MGTYYYYYCVMRVMACAGVWFFSDKMLTARIGRDRKDVREIFEPVVSQVLELISKQVIEVLKSGEGPVAVNLPPSLQYQIPVCNSILKIYRQFSSLVALGPRNTCISGSTSGGPAR